MKFNPGGRLASTAVGLTIVGVLLLSACSSDSNSGGKSSGGSSSAGGGSSCPTGTLKGEGSTAQKNAMDEWTKQYQQQCSGATVNYNGTGSGDGVKNFIGKQVDFAGSDSALKADKGEVANAAKTCASPAVDLPMVVGPIAVAFKLKDIKDAGLTLTPKLVAQIFLGKITKWNDPAITAANSGVTLPATAITVFFRSDESGTTENFEKYLAAAAPADFKAKPSKAWAGTVGQGKAKSGGVQAAIGATEGGIGYVEASFAIAGNLSTAKIDNGGGAVAIDADTASKAAGAAKVVGTGDDVTLKIDYATKMPGAYPIILVTYEIACTKYADPKIGALVKSFLTYTSGSGQEALANLGYAPIPDSIKAKVTATIAKIS
ncbi:MAG: phosphate ABC transporter substrate-binding protein PstS [Actinomycetota bacterium]|nr:phosphate ABC transporter substrate-binding protein PstS [Actinomycetota bacterium]